MDLEGRKITVPGWFFGDMKRGAKYYGTLGKLVKGKPDDSYATYKDEPKKVFWHPVDSVRQWLDPIPKTRVILKVKHPLQRRSTTLKEEERPVARAAAAPRVIPRGDSSDSSSDDEEGAPNLISSAIGATRGFGPAPAPQAAARGPRSARHYKVRSSVVTALTGTTNASAATGPKGSAAGATPSAALAQAVEGLGLDSPKRRDPRKKGFVARAPLQ